MIKINDINDLYEIHNMNKAFINILNDKGISSPKTLSEMTGIDKATISRQMSNKQALSLNNIAKYSEVLNVPKGKFIEEYVPFYWIVGYINNSIAGLAEVTGRREEDPQKVIFPNHYKKKEFRKVLYDIVTNHLIIYDVDINQKTRSSNSFLNTFCFIRTKKDYMSGFMGFVTKLTSKKVEITHLSGQKSGPMDYHMVYAVMVTYNMRNSSDDIAIIDG
jgi:transcriptional regulator with XRE-family HTH domain